MHCQGLLGDVAEAMQARCAPGGVRRRQNKKRDPDAADTMIRETPLSLDGCILHRPLQDVNRQIAKNRNFIRAKFCHPSD